MPAHSFSRVASFYDALAQLVFGASLLRSQQAHLSLVPDGARVLFIGGGTGKLLLPLLSQTRCREVVFLEASAKMLARAQALIGPKHAGRVSFRLGTQENLAPEDKFDVILSPFFLDLFAPMLLHKITSRLHQALMPGGCWLVSDFVRLPGRGLRQALAATLLGSMYLFFRLTCGISAASLPDWQQHLAGLGLKPVASAYFYHGLIKSVAYQKAAVESCLNP